MFVSSLWEEQGILIITYGGSLRGCLDVFHGHTNTDSASLNYSLLEAP
jgi:hypothetical protein